jgi:hypothetical protein
MRSVVLCAALAAVVLFQGPGSAAPAGSEPTQLSFQVCPNITQTVYPEPAGGNDLAAWTTRIGCGAAVASAALADCSGTPHTNTDLGTFRLSQNPLGVGVQLSGRNDCSTSPPRLGAGIRNGELSVTITKTGFCPETSTVAGRTGEASVVFPIGSLSFGAYRVAVAFPGQGVFSGTQAAGTLHVGGLTFTETDTNALAVHGTHNAFAALLDNSFAGRGAGDLAATRIAPSSKTHLTGTDYYACGTIKTAANITFGQRTANGLVRVTGDGLITDGTGNYESLKGSFTVRGTYNMRAGRGTLKLRGIATY